MKEKAPHMPFYGREFYSDENVIVMSLEQEAVYQRLLWNCWQEGSIPADMAKLAAIAKNMAPAWFERKIWPAISPCFTPTSDGRLINTKVEALRAAKNKFAAECSDAGKRGNDKRWGPHRVPDKDPTETRSGGDHESIAVDYRLPIADCRIENLSLWDEFKTLYPQHRFDDPEKAFSAHEDQAGIVAALRNAIDSGEWQKDNGQWLPMASHFVGGRYNCFRQPQKPESQYQDYIPVASRKNAA